MLYSRAGNYPAKQPMLYAEDFPPSTAQRIAAHRSASQRIAAHRSASQRIAAHRE